VSAPESLRSAAAESRAGFSLVELLVVVGILGTLVSLSLPAVQSAREAARRSACSNNLRQMGIALLNYESARRGFPPGDDAVSGRNHAWSSFILPFIEEEQLSRRINYSVPWNEPANLELAEAMVGVYLCPSGIVTYPGKQDYGGVMGTAVVFTAGEELPPGWQHGGILYATSQEWPRPCRAAEVTDGLSRTLLVSEGVDRGFPDQEGSDRIGNARWACGTNCFFHNSPVLNTPLVDGFRSNHIGGVHGLYGDGHVSFMSDGTFPDVLIAVCTKAGAEATEEIP
jgi:prepilin-type N-terminal cleavage/methylation domain-containing protein